MISKHFVSICADNLAQDLCEISHPPKNTFFVGGGEDTLGSVNEKEKEVVTFRTWTFRVVYVPVYWRLRQQITHQLRHWNQQQQHTPHSTRTSSYGNISDSLHNLHRAQIIQWYSPGGAHMYLHQHTFPLTDMSLRSSRRHLDQFSRFCTAHGHRQRNRQTHRQTDRHQIIALLVWPSV